MRHPELTDFVNRSNHCINVKLLHLKQYLFRAAFYSQWMRWNTRQDGLFVLCRWTHTSHTCFQCEWQPPTVSPAEVPLSQKQKQQVWGRPAVIRPHTQEAATRSTWSTWPTWPAACHTHSAVVKEKPIWLRAALRLSDQLTRVSGIIHHALNNQPALDTVTPLSAAGRTAWSCCRLKTCGGSITWPSPPAPPWGQSFHLLTETSQHNMCYHDSSDSTTATVLFCVQNHYSDGFRRTSV